MTKDHWQEGWFCREGKGETETLRRRTICFNSRINQKQKGQTMHILPTRRQEDLVSSQWQKGWNTKQIQTYLIFIFNCILSALYFMQIAVICSVLLLRHATSKEFNCKPKDSHLQWYFRKTIFKLWVETGGEYDWRVSTEWKQVPGAWVRAFKTKCRRRVLISGMCLWLCLRYEDRMLLDLCSELGCSHNP